jgi:hypothetical protein
MVSADASLFLWVRMTEEYPEHECNTTKTAGTRVNKIKGKKESPSCTFFFFFL